MWVTCSRCSWRSSSGLCPALELQGGRLRSGQASDSPRHPLPHFPHLTHPLASPTSTHNSTLYSPGLSSSGGCWTLPSLAPLQGGGGCVRPEPQCQGSFPPNPVEVVQPRSGVGDGDRGGVLASFLGPLLLPLSSHPPSPCPLPHSSAEADPGTSGSSPEGSSGPVRTFSELRPSDSANFWASSRPCGVSEYLVGGGGKHRSPFFTHTWQALLPAAG